MVQRSGLKQASVYRHVFGNDHRRPKLEAFRQTIRLVRDDPSGHHAHRAHAETVAHFDAKAVQRPLRKIGVVAAGRSGLGAIGQGKRAEQRVIVFNRFQLHRGGGVIGAGHGLQAVTARHFAIFAQSGEFVG